MGDSVAAYYQNINTHKVTESFDRCGWIYEPKRALDDKALIPTLWVFRTGKQYLKILRSVLRSDYIQLAQQVESHASQWGTFGKTARINL